jgi:uncharacterized protein with GYD domain
MESEMITYIVLWNFTEQGARNIKLTTERGDVFRAQAEELGVRVKDYYWTLGGYDGVIIMEAPDDEKIARLILLTCALGTVRATALRAFSRVEIDRILS